MFNPQQAYYKELHQSCVGKAGILGCEERRDLVFLGVDAVDGMQTSPLQQDQHASAWRAACVATCPPFYYKYYSPAHEPAPHAPPLHTHGGEWSHMGRGKAGRGSAVPGCCSAVRERGRDRGSAPS